MDKCKYVRRSTIPINPSIGAIEMSQSSRYYVHIRTVVVMAPR